jgi:gliding motility-associated-like protein
MTRYILQLGLSLLPLLGWSQTCPTVTATNAQGATSVNLNCSSATSPAYTNCFAATVQFPSFKNTDTYAVQSQAYVPVLPYNSGTSIAANDDDKFVYNLTLPFSFCFFGQNYNNIVLGTNAKITFNQRLMGNVDFPNYTQQNPNLALGVSSVFAASQDLVFSPTEGSDIFYSVLGQAPCRQVVINFYNGRLVGCTQRYSSQIVLHENTNAIEVSYEGRTAPCGTARFSNALVGIIDASGNVGYSPANRNTGNWTSGNESYRFEPSGADVVPSINWYNSANALVASGQNVQLCPTKSENYTVKVNYALCQNGSYVLSDDFPVNLDVNLPSPKDLTEKFCMTTAGDYNYDMRNYELRINPRSNNFNFSYFANVADAIANRAPMGNTGSVTNAGLNFVVKVSSQTDPNCYKIANVSFSKFNQTVLKQSVKVCDFKNDGIEPNYLLSQLNPQIIPLGYNGPISYHLNQNDADKNINPITNGNLVNGSQVWLRLADINCTYVYQITIELNGSPLFIAPVSYQTRMCDYNADDNEPFAWQRIFRNLITNDQSVVKLKFFYTYNEAFDGADAAGLSDIKMGNYKVYVRLENANKCFSIAEIDMSVVFDQIIVNPVEHNICFDGQQDFNINLNDYSGNMLVSPLDGTVLPLSYHATREDAEKNINPISNLQSITRDGDLVQTDYFVRFAKADGCYTVRPISVYLVHPVAYGEPEVCDLLNDGTETINPNDYSNIIIGPQTGATVTYYANLADANANATPITSLAVTGRFLTWAKINFRGCTNTVLTWFKLVPTPVLPKVTTITINNLCDNNADAIEPVNLNNYIRQIYTGPERVNVEFFEQYDALSNGLSNPVLPWLVGAYPVRATNPLIYAKVIFVNGCASVTALDIKVNFYPLIVVKEATLEQCNVTFQVDTSYVLSQAIPQLFVQANNTVPLGNLQITYHSSKANADAGIMPINVNYTTVLTKDVVYARFYNPVTQCFSVGKININTYTPPKALNSVIQVCDNNLDGLYDVNFLNYLDKIPAVISPDNKFMFYLSQADAMANRNAIQNPANYSANPFPNRVWVRVENIINCNDINIIDFTFGTKVQPTQTQFEIILCDIDNNNTEPVDLSQIESKTGITNGIYQYYLNKADMIADRPMANHKAYVVLQAQQDFIVKVSAPNLCPVALNVRVKLVKTPILKIENPLVCPGDYTTINPDVTGLDVVGYRWMDAQGQVFSTKPLVAINQAGPYSLELTNSQGCTYVSKFSLLHKPVPNIIKLHLIDEQTGVYVEAMGLENRKIEYSKDAKIWQKESTFDQIPKGTTTFYVRYENDNCSVSKAILIPFIYNIFTPQNDGVNDTWVLEGLDVFGQEKSKIEIYDRYQRLMFKQESNTKFEWNGHFDQRVEPSAAYWYIIDFPDGRQYTGWIIIKNRH